MKKTNFFQIGLMVFAGFCVIVAMVLIATSKGKPKSSEGLSKDYGKVTIWSSISLADDTAQFFSELNKEYAGSVKFEYLYIPEDRFDQALLEALANGKGPDALIISNVWILRNLPRITPITYKTNPDEPLLSMSQRTFRDTFINAADVFTQPSGILGLPLFFDPLVMYWNRDIFTEANIVSPPKTWTELLAMVPKLTQKDKLDIVRAGVGLGEYTNVNNARDLIALLFLQSGNPITKLGNPSTSALLGDEKVADALRFYTDFANPLKPIYSWNRSLPNTQEAFLGNQVAIYFDFASAIKRIQLKNPRLYFDIAPVPQTGKQDFSITSGRLYSMFALKGRNVQGAQVAGQILSSKETNAKLVKLTGLPSARRDLLVKNSTELFQSILVDSTIKGKIWFSPPSKNINPIFERMIDSVTSGKYIPSEAIKSADEQLNTELLK